MSRNVRLNYDFVKEQFEKEGYWLLTSKDEFVGGNRQQLQFICPKGHKYYITYSSFYRGKRCKKCAIENLGNLLRTKFSDIIKSVTFEGYTLLTLEKEYKNERSKIKTICPNGHIYETKWANWKKGCRCVTCQHNSRKLTYEFVKKEFEKRGWELLSTEYIESSHKLKYKCENGHIEEMTYASFYVNNGCPTCLGTKKKTIEEVREAFLKEGYILLSTKYSNNKKHLEVLCPEGHKIKMRYDQWTRGMRCGVCFKSRSKAEKEVSEFVKSIYIGEVLENSQLISPYEIDMELPEKKIAIEYCGLYWHSVLKGKGEKYHLNKFLRCKKKGYRLITIFEDEWLYDQERVKTKLKRIINPSVFNTDTKSLKKLSEFIKNNKPTKLSIVLDNKWECGSDFNWFKPIYIEFIKPIKWKFFYDKRLKLNDDSKYTNEIYDCGYTKLTKVY